MSFPDAATDLSSDAVAAEALQDWMSAAEAWHHASLSKGLSAEQRRILRNHSARCTAKFNEPPPRPPPIPRPDDHPENWPIDHPA